MQLMFLIKRLLSKNAKQYFLRLYIIDVSMTYFRSVRVVSRSSHVAAVCVTTGTYRHLADLPARASAVSDLRQMFAHPLTTYHHPGTTHTPHHRGSLLTGFTTVPVACVRHHPVRVSCQGAARSPGFIVSEAGFIVSGMCGGADKTLAAGGEGRQTHT